MSNQRCPRCGFFAGATDTVCRQCGVGLTASPYVDAVFNEAPRWTEATPQQMQSTPYGGAIPLYGAPTKDDEHLKLLSIFHYVVGGLIGLMACIPIVHLVIGIGLMVAGGSSMDSGGGPPAIVGGVLALVALLLIGMGWTLAGCVISAGRNLRRHRRRTFCMVVASILCLWMPFGTALGIFTLVVLSRPSVKQLFQRSSSL